MRQFKSLQRLSARGLSLLMAVFFKSRGNREGEPAEREIKRDMNALLRGKRDGKIVIENNKPKVTGGRHKVIDEKFNAAAETIINDNGRS